MNAGELVCVVGRNGTGKSTLLRVLSGELTPSEGIVTLDGAPLASLRPLALARRRAVLPQQGELAFSFSVRDVVAMGRTPHRGAPASEPDAAIAAAALRAVDLAGREDERYDQLSGGEQQRVQLARVVAQAWPGADPAPVLLLDEPTSALDLAQVYATLALVRELTRSGCGALAILHDLNAAARFADRVVVLSRGRVAAHGTPARVLDSGCLRDHFGVDAEVRHRGGRASAHHTASASLHHNPVTVMNEALNPAPLAERWASLTADEPKLRIRDAAARLDASEAQLVATRVGAGVVRLTCEPGRMLEAVPEFGHVMALTRNEAVVHEREGTYEDVQIGGHASLVLGLDIDLRCFLRHWVSAFAVTSESPRGTLHSIQFFDAAGDAVHKIYLREAERQGCVRRVRRALPRRRPEHRARGAAAGPGAGAEARRRDRHRWLPRGVDQDERHARVLRHPASLRRHAHPGPSARARRSRRPARASGRSSARSSRRQRRRPRSWCSSATPAASRSTPVRCGA